MAGRRAEGSGFELHPERMSCLITRFQLRSAFLLPLFYWAFRKVRADASRLPGLVTTSFLVESPRVCFTLSLWTSDQAIREFNTLVTHVQAARWSMQHVYSTQSRRAELCSLHWHLWAASRNRRWGNVDIGAFLDPAPSAESKTV